MNSKVLNKLIELNEQLNFIDIEIDNQIKKCENAIDIILKSINAVKKMIAKNSFRSDLDEIHFFKEIKPQFTSKLIYFNVIYKIEMKRPNGGNRILKKYYHNELSKLKAFFDNELEFYQYYRSGSIYLDYKYFQRGKFDIKLALDNFSPLKKILNGIKTSKIIRFSRFFAFTDLPNYSSNSISKGANARP